MVITLTNEALKKLKVLKSPEGQVARIDADISGGCGMSVTLSLTQDEPRRNDKILEYDGIKIHMDAFTERYLEEETNIDYREGEGFIIGEHLFSSACSIEV